MTTFEKIKRLEIAQSLVKDCKKFLEENKAEFFLGIRNTVAPEEFEVTELEFEGPEDALSGFEWEDQWVGTYYGRIDSSFFADPVAWRDRKIAERAEKEIKERAARALATEELERKRFEAAKKTYEELKGKYE
jgi:hypothetical protein